MYLLLIIKACEEYKNIVQKVSRDRSNVTFLYPNLQFHSYTCNYILPPIKATKVFTNRSEAINSYELLTLLFYNR